MVACGIFKTFGHVDIIRRTYVRAIIRSIDGDLRHSNRDDTIENPVKILTHPPSDNFHISTKSFKGTNSDEVSFDKGKLNLQYLNVPN